MRLTFRTCLNVAAVAAGLLAGGAASAQGTWNLGANGTYTSTPPDYCSPQTSGALTGASQCTAQGSGAGGINATMYAFSNTGSSGAFVNTGLVSYDPLGFGTLSGSSETGYSGQHAFDNQTTNCGTASAPVSTNCGGSVELMLINFSSAVKLTAIDFSWKDTAGNAFTTDADFSVYRADTPPASGGGSLGAVSSATGSTSLGTGWTLVGSADMLQQGTDKLNPNTGGSTGIAATNAKEMTVDQVASSSGNTNGLYSSWWVISTYFGPNSGNLNAGNDAFKILSFAATGCTGTVSSNGVCTTSNAGVPEPATLALVSLALVGAGWVGRRRFAQPPAPLAQ